MSYVDPIGSGLKSARIDMGVDYTGSGNLFALGSGTVTQTKNSGWPGGTFIGIKLDSGQYVYYAENIIPKVTVGQRVTAGQVIGFAVGTYPYVEVGWAAPPGTGQTAADAAGQDRAGLAKGDPGAFPTGYGVAMSRLIQSLGGPPGVQSGPVQGSIPANLTSSSGASSASAGGCVPGASLIAVIYVALQCRTQRRRYLQGYKRAYWKGSREAHQ